LTLEWQRRRDAGDFAARISELGRSLGKARDADVRIELLRYFEARLPHAASSLALVRQRQERDRLMLARKLIKQLERLEVGEELARLSARAAWPRRRFWVAMTGAWRHQLRQLVAERAQAASAALVYATGVYFPNRSHAARIAIKKFRYAVEIGDQTGLLADQAAVAHAEESPGSAGRAARSPDAHRRIDQRRREARGRRGTDRAGRARWPKSKSAISRRVCSHAAPRCSTRASARCGGWTVG
jgi:hypothetical protein